MNNRSLSVMNGKDTDVLPILIELHSSSLNPKILDCTYNKGTMWKGLSYKPTRMDINPVFDLDVVGDFKNMPFPDKSYDVIVFDPQFLPSDGARGKASKIWETTYGITDSPDREGDNVSGLFEPFIKEAKRVLVEDGIILAKMCDIIHNHRYRWQHIDLILAAQKEGLTACDMMIKCDPQAGKLMSSKWQNVRHLRKAHCYWIVIRNSNRCEIRRENLKSNIGL